MALSGAERMRRCRFRKNLRVVPSAPRRRPKSEITKAIEDCARAQLADPATPSDYWGPLMFALELDD
jgi:hypothetical protein